MPKIGEVEKGIPNEGFIPPPSVGIAMVGQAIAINLPDLDRASEFVRSILLVGKLDLSNAIQMDKDRFDEMGVAFSCDLLAAACICDTIRTHDKNVGDYPTRVYVRRTVAWMKVPGTKLLSVISNNEVILNPDLFRDDSVVEYVPPAEETKVEVRGTSLRERLQSRAK